MSSKEMHYNRWRNAGRRFVCTCVCVFVCTMYMCLCVRYFISPSDRVYVSLRVYVFECLCFNKSMRV